MVQLAYLIFREKLVRSLEITKESHSAVKFQDADHWRIIHLMVGVSKINQYMIWKSTAQH